jgi:hypothetical protein
MKSNIFYDMGKQMTPSDQVVNELLSKIQHAEKISKSNKRWAIGTVACVAIAIPVAMAFLKVPGISSGLGVPSSETSMRTLQNPNGIDNNTAKIPSWAERSYPSRYDTLYMDGKLFTSTKGKIEKGKLDRFLFQTTLTGYDYTDPNFYIDKKNAKQYKLNAAAYSVKGINQKFMVAIQYENQDGFYSYIPNDYVPKTLGEFIDNLNLKENLTIGTIQYESEKDGQKQKATYALSDVSAVWDILLKNTSAKYVNPNGLGVFGGEMGIKVSMNIAAEKDDYISVSKSGYLFTNIYKTMKAFYIGEDNATAFTNYVLKNGTLQDN